MKGSTIVLRTFSDRSGQADLENRAVAGRALHRNRAALCLDVGADEVQSQAPGRAWRGSDRRGRGDRKCAAGPARRCRARYPRRESRRHRRRSSRDRSTRPPRGVYLIALSTRFASAWRSRSRSAGTVRSAGTSAAQRDAGILRGVFVQIDDFRRQLRERRPRSRSASSCRSRLPRCPSTSSASTARARIPRGSPTSASRCLAGSLVASADSAVTRRRVIGVRRSCAT